MQTQANKMGHAWSWRADSIAGIECFQAQAIIHHYGRHSHDAYAIGVIEEGVAGNDYRGASHYIPAGDIVVMNPDEPHTGYSVDDQPMSYRLLYIDADVIRDVLPEHARLPYFRDFRIHNDYWAEQALFLHRILSNHAEALEQQSHLYEILPNFIRAFSDSSFAETAGREPSAIEQIKKFLRANYQRNVSIDELAQLTQLNRAYLIRAFRRSVGIPPYHWLLQVRIGQAKKLLSQGTPIAEVAFEVGFADQSHLTRRFKSITGLTPGQYAAGHFRSRQDRAL